MAKNKDSGIETYALDELLAKNLKIVSKHSDRRDRTEAAEDDHITHDGEIVAFDSATGKGIVTVENGRVDVDLSQTKLLNDGYIVLRPGRRVQVEMPADGARYAPSLRAI